MAADGSQVAPIPMDCGKSGACHGCPKPCTASTPKMTGMCSRECAIANDCMVLYSSAQSRPVLPVSGLPVLSVGMSVPPARIEPTLLSTKIFCSHTGLGRLKPPWLVHVLLVSVTCVTSIWTIWPIFSGSVIWASSLFTRAWTGGSWAAELLLAAALAGAVLVTATAEMAAATTTAAAAAVNGRVRPVALPGSLIQCLVDESCLIDYLPRTTGSDAP